MSYVIVGVIGSSIVSTIAYRVYETAQEANAPAGLDNGHLRAIKGDERRIDVSERQ